MGPYRAHVERPKKNINDMAVPLWPNHPSRAVTPLALSQWTANFSLSMRGEARSWPSSSWMTGGGRLTGGNPGWAAIACAKRDFCGFLDLGGQAVILLSWCMLAFPQGFGLRGRAGVGVAAMGGRGGVSSIPLRGNWAQCLPMGIDGGPARLLVIYFSKFLWASPFAALGDKVGRVCALQTIARLDPELLEVLPHGEDVRFRLEGLDGGVPLK